MAVEDWPTTQGHWFYPLPSWITAFWDFFLEHGHRMLAQVVGLISIALAVVLWRLDRRKWMRWLALAVVVGVVVQGVLGGLRVVGDGFVEWLEATRAPGMAAWRILADDLLLRKVHGCTAPLFLALCVALLALTSRRWLESDGPQEHAAARRLHRLTLAAMLGIYLLIVLGAQLRHLPPGFEVAAWLKFVTARLMSTWFELWVWLKLTLAGLMVAVLTWLLLHVLRQHRREPMLVRRVKWLIGLFLIQLVLGAGTWVTNYNWPGWFTEYLWSIEYTPLAEGRLQVVTTTAHAAVGSLTLAISLSLLLWSRRLLRGLPQ